MYYNEYDKNPTKDILMKRKKKKLRKRLILLFLICAIIMVIVLLSGQYLKVKSISIEGNTITNYEDIIKNISIDKQSYYFFINKNKLSKEIISIPTIEKASVDIDLLGNVLIHVDESQPEIYTYIKNKVYVGNEKGEVYEEKNKERIEELYGLPKVTGLSLELFTTLAKQYPNIQSIIKNDISDIVYKPLPQDKTRIQMLLQDYNIIDIRIEDIDQWLTDRKTFDLEAQKMTYPKGHMIYNFYVDKYYFKERD